MMKVGSIEYLRVIQSQHLLKPSYVFVAVDWAIGEIERLKAIVDELLMDAEGTIYPGLRGKGFWHPGYLRPATIVFYKLFWHPFDYWAMRFLGHEVRFAECYPTREAAEAARKGGE